MANVVILADEKRNILEEIINQLELSDRYLVQKYLKKERLRSEDRERIEALESAMKHQQFSWWNSSHPQERAYRQFFCSTLILNFARYKQDMQILLRRSVEESELFERRKIMEEVSEKYHLWLKNK